MLTEPPNAPQSSLKPAPRPPGSLDETTAAQEARRRREDVERVTRARWANAGFGILHIEQADQGCRWTDNARAALDIVMVANTNAVVVLNGPRGTGKTQMAACLTRQRAIEFSWLVRYYRTADLLDQVRRGFNESKSEADSIAVALKCDLLILDEVQERNETAWEDRTLTRVVDARYIAKKPTLLITNVVSEKLEGMLGASIYDRIREAGGVITLTGSSWRAQKAEARTAGRQVGS